MVLDVLSRVGVKKIGRGTADSKASVKSRSKGGQFCKVDRLECVLVLAIDLRCLMVKNLIY